MANRLVLRSQENDIERLHKKKELEDPKKHNYGNASNASKSVRAPLRLLNSSNEPQSIVSRNPQLMADENIKEITPIQLSEPSSFGNRAGRMFRSGLSQAQEATKGMGEFMSKPGMSDAVSAGVGMTAEVLDPEGTGLGPAASYAASGASIGTAVFPGIGTAVGAAIGAGLGLIKANQNRKEIQRKADFEAAGIRAQGMENAAKAIRGGMVQDSFAAKRRLKL